MSGVADPHWQASFERVYAAESLQLPWYPTLGNHDWRGDVQAQIDYSGHSDRWSMPARYYARRIPLPDGGALRLVLLDTLPLIREAAEAGPGQEPWAASEQLRWADGVLADAGGEWTVVAGHHPIHSGGSRHGPSAVLQRMLEPLLEKHDVDVYLAGHEHHLEHLTGVGATHHFISGAGSRLRPFRGSPRSEFGTSRPGFLLVSATSERLLFQLVGHAGHVLHTAELSADHALTGAGTGISGDDATDPHGLLAQ